MSSSVYCVVSNGNVQVVPINKFSLSKKFDIGGETDEAFETLESKFSPTISKDVKMKIRNKNRLYSLNEPSLSDFDSDSHTEFANGSSTQVESSPATSPSPPNRGLETPKVIDKYSTYSMYLPEYTVDMPEDVDAENKQIKNILVKVFPQTWTDAREIQIKKVTGGITNMLLSCTYTSTNDTVLMRIYGQGTNLIIDRHREFVLHLVLNSLDLAPPIYSRFKNGLIYGFLEGRSLEPEELRDERLYPCIAQQLGNWHNSINGKDIEEGVDRLRKYTVEQKKTKEQRKNGEYLRKKNKKTKKRFISNIYELIEDWINIVPITTGLMESFQENLKRDITQENAREIIQEEFSWLKSTTESSKSPTVVSHCDLLSGNVIIQNSEDGTTFKLPSLETNPVKFIDYEYMLPAPRAFDIANHFSEWQGFDCDRSAIPEPSPSNPTMARWVKGYLNNENASSDQVSRLIEEISEYYGMPGFYWGIWAMIQSEISDIDFNYVTYGRSRLQEYWDWKARFLRKSS